MITLSRRVHFSSGHKYYNENWDEARNLKTFGSSFSKHGHGHNYTLEAQVSGSVDPETGMIINLADLDKVLVEVSDLLDHKFLNSDVEYFKQNMPTTENIAIFCFEKTFEKLKAYTSAKLHKVRIYESDDLWADYYG